MSNRKAIEAEINRYDKLATRLESNLKNITQTLVTDRNTSKARLDEKERKVIELDRENAKLKAIADCMDKTQKMFEKHAFTPIVRDQNLFSNAIVEAASRYAGDPVPEMASSMNPPSENETSRSRGFTFVPTVANDRQDDIVDLGEDDEGNDHE